MMKQNNQINLELLKSESPQTKMNLFQLLFGFSGRIDRFTFWVKGIIPLIFVLLIINLFVGKLGQYRLNFDPLSISILFLLWIFLALSIKRSHDINSRGLSLTISILILVFMFSDVVFHLPELLIIWLILPLYISIGILIWNFSKLLFYKSDIGNNQFGEAPTNRNPLKLSIHPILIKVLACLLPVLYLLGIIISNYGYSESEWGFLLLDRGIPSRLAELLDPVGQLPYLKYFIFLCLIPFVVFNKRDKL